MALRLKLSERMYDLVRDGYKKEIYLDCSSLRNPRISTFSTVGEEIIVASRRRPNLEFLATKNGIHEGRPDWGAAPGVRYHVLSLLGRA